MDAVTQISSNTKYFCYFVVIEVDTINLGKIEGGTVDTELCKQFCIGHEIEKLIIRQCFCVVAGRGTQEVLQFCLNPHSGFGSGRTRENVLEILHGKTTQATARGSSPTLAMFQIGGQVVSR